MKRLVFEISVFLLFAAGLVSVFRGSTLATEPMPDYTVKGRTTKGLVNFDVDGVFCLGVAVLCVRFGQRFGFGDHYRRRVHAEVDDSYRRQLRTTEDKKQERKRWSAH